MTEPRQEAKPPPEKEAIPLQKEHAPVEKEYCIGPDHELQTQAYREFTLKLHEQYGSKQIPGNGTIELIENCNFRCLHCYQGQEKHKEILSGQEWMEIAGQLEKEGMLWILLTGGEPLLHPDFIEVYTYLIRKGFLVTLFTNGALFKEEHFELLKRYPPFSVEITLYGSSEEMYEKITGTRSSFEKVMATSKRLLTDKIPLQLKTVVMKPLLDDFWNLAKIASDLGVRFRFDTKIDPSIYGESLNHLRMSPTEKLDLEEAYFGEELIKKDSEYLTSYRNGVAKKRTEAEKEKLYTCGAGKSSCFIDFRGRVHACIVDRYNEANYSLKKYSFKEIWNEMIPKIINQKRTKIDAKCASCEVTALCDTCPALAKLATGDREGRPDYVCEETVERKSRMLKYIVPKEESHV
ncbi:MAG: radical SAM protein [Planctomycetes bacterium]|nr:radical SAM protein [Planctomycetota bacterium]